MSTPAAKPPMQPAAFVIEPVTDTASNVDALAQLLIETVASGASVSFMHPLAPERARAFWRGVLASAQRGERIVLGAFADDELVATVSLVIDMPENQPHRAEIGKLMTRMAHRGNGAARALMHAAESCAIDAGRTLIVLDTAERDGAAGLYEKLGYQRVGTIPDFASGPHGGLCGTILFYKRIGQAAPPIPAPTAR